MVSLRFILLPLVFFFFNDTATTEIYTLSLHDALPFFYAGLSLIVIGTGLLKPNASTLVGSLYEQEDERRDAGFSIFYMGINLGALFGPIVAGRIAEGIDWHLGF